MSRVEPVNNNPRFIHQDYPLANWAQDVTNDDTRLGYLAWVEHKKTSRSPYTVCVGNVGNIPCDTLEEANDIFEAYKYQSIHNYGRAAGEDVSIIDAHSAIIKEHKGHFEHI